ncbi:uncharacterized protein LOC128678482 [Plodia interpunctella]|uniref:uncharacterized protein LOC128678482 n=1 Tax=Plodia interpunctella TaxID=58824 RepID=UPI002368E1BC|nr:uncharacterized protein LOC128678482 [Plodia interpunctella]
MYTIKLYVILCLLCHSYAFKILVLFPLPGTSHGILGEGIVRHLLKAGHEVTYVTPLPYKDPPRNLTIVDVSSNFELMAVDEYWDFKKLMAQDVNLQDFSKIVDILYLVSNGTVFHNNVQSMMMDPKVKFDVVIAEWMYSEIYSGFAPVFNCPLIWSSSMEPHAAVLSLIDEDPNPAYTADHMSSQDPPFSFPERVSELWTLLKIKYAKWSRYDRDSATYNNAFSAAAAARGNRLPPLNEAMYSASLMLGNSYVATGQPTRLPQNYKAIAGYHIKEELKPLPENLQKVMDEAKHGVIYFSMGSLLKSKTWPEEIKRDILKMFSELKQTVIWKFEENLPNLPANVHIVQWAPQPSILAHPNCILFITHGGLLSTTETMHYGVPVIGIPIFADQFINVNRAVHKGYGLKVDLNFNIPANLRSSIQEIIGNPSYRERVKELSFIYHHRVAPPSRELVHWVRHVVLTRGAPHLRSRALDLPFYQRMYLDLIALVLLLVFGSLCVVRKFVIVSNYDAVKKNSKMLKFTLLLCILACGHVTESYKILAVFPTKSTSHHNLAMGVVTTLLQAGHEVTQITPYPSKDLPPNLKQVDTSAVDMSVFTDKLNVTTVLRGEDPMSFFEFKPFLETENRYVLTDPNVQRLLNDTTQTFDVVIAEWMFSESFAGFGAVYDCPFIWVSTMEPHSQILKLIDEHSNPAYFPNIQSSATIPPFGFIDRMKELLFQSTMFAFDLFYITNYHNELYNEVIAPQIIKRGRPAIPFSDIKYKASLVLGNSYVSLGIPVRLPQAYKLIGGYHIDPVVKPLPDHLKNILDNAKNGLIYFSMGSILKSRDLPDELKKDLLEVLGSLKHTVLWKFEEVLPNLPPNVHIVHWAPQQSILAHPNCILFITHGGLLSTTEAVHFGKPIIGIPVFGDQINNVDRSVNKGFAIKVNLAYDMKDKLKAAIEEMLRNKSYTEKAKELSLIYHDRPTSPREELVHWVEHVIKTRGAPHLRSPALDVPVYQKLYLDLLALVLAVLYVLKKIVVKIFSKKSVDKKLKMN